MLTYTSLVESYIETLSPRENPEDFMIYAWDTEVLELWCRGSHILTFNSAAPLVAYIERETGRLIRTLSMTTVKARDGMLWVRFQKR